MNIAFFGLGAMGIPMVTNLLRAGYAVTVWNRTPKEGLDEVVWADTPAAAVAGTDILITMLADDNANRAALLDSGALDTLKPGTVHINMATISVELAQELAARHRENGRYYLAAPVLGRPPVAQAGQLQILVAGDLPALERVRPVLEVLGQQIWYLGETPEQANATKLAVNFMIGSAIATMGEAAGLVEGYGVDKKLFIDLISSTVFSAPVYKGYGKSIAEDVYEPAGFKLSLGLKDIRLTLDAGGAVQAKMPLATTIRDLHDDSLAHNEGQLDWAALAKVFTR